MLPAQTIPIAPQQFDDQKKEAKQDTNTLKELKALGIEPSRPQRWLRQWQYQYQLLEQPEYITVTSGGLTTTVLNPNKWLQQHSISLNFAELVPRATNLPEMVEAAYNETSADNKPFRLDSSICKDPRHLDCLADGGGFLQRLISSTTMTLSVAQRDQVQQGVIAPTLSPSQAWAWTGQADWNEDHSVGLKALPFTRSKQTFWISVSIYPLAT
jgi:hypothetical protein